MKMDLRGESHFHSSRGLEGKRMSFGRRKEINLSIGPASFQTFIAQEYPIAARILFNGQRAIISEEGKHSIEPGRSIEFP